MLRPSSTFDPGSRLILVRVDDTLVYHGGILNPMVGGWRAKHRKLIGDKIHHIPPRPSKRSCPPVRESNRLESSHLGTVSDTVPRLKSGDPDRELAPHRQLPVVQPTPGRRLTQVGFIIKCSVGYQQVSTGKPSVNWTLCQAIRLALFFDCSSVILLLLGTQPQKAMTFAHIHRTTYFLRTD